MDSDNRELSIRISGVKKMYKLGQIGGGTLQADLQSWWARKRGKVDPNTKIGAEQKARLVGQTFMALNGIDLTVYKGEALGIIGGNGAGKSTLLKLISQVTAPTEGKIELWGRVASMLEVGTGFNGEMTGRENVYMNGAILGMTKAEIDAKMENIIDFSEVREFIDTPVKRYSSGMYVKLAFSVAAHLDSEIMIMDEVLAVGDVAFQKKCIDKMRDAANKEGRTVLYVSHNMNTIRQLCDRCIVLDKGKVVYEGDVEKSIDIYLGTKAISDRIVDLEKIERHEEFCNHPVTMKRLEVNTDSGIFRFGSKLVATMEIDSSRFIEKAWFSVALRSIGGTSVSSYSMNKPIRLEKNLITKITFEMDISSIAPGNYSLNPVISLINEFGAKEFLDGLHGAYCFEIAGDAMFNQGKIWNPIYSGYYVAPEIKMISEEISYE